MRKTITYFFLFAMIFALCSPAFAAEYSDPNDSRYIDSDVLSELNDPSTEVVVKAYNCSPLDDFSKYDNIEDVLAYRNTPRWLVYIKKDASGLSAYSYYASSGYTEFSKDSSSYVNGCRRVLQEFQTQEAIQTVSADVVVECVYFIYGAARREGSAIYYKTNLGDYVFYYDSTIGCELLFAAERFFEFQKAAKNAVIANNADGIRFGVPDYSSWDLSAYDYRSDNFDPHAPFPISAEPEQTPSPYLWIGIAGAVVLTAIAAFLIVKAKRKAAILPEEA